MELKEDSEGGGDDNQDDSMRRTTGRRQRRMRTSTVAWERAQQQWHDEGRRRRTDCNKKEVGETVGQSETFKHKHKNTQEICLPIRRTMCPISSRRSETTSLSDKRQKGKHFEMKT